MKRFIYGVILVSLFVTEARAEARDEEQSWKARAWTGSEVALATSFAIGNFLDIYQTSQIERIGAQEANLLFRNSDGSPNMRRVVVAKSIVLGGVMLVLHYFPHHARKQTLKIMNVLQFGVVIWNEGATGGLLFKF